MSRDFFDEYLHYNRGGEVPATFHRWSAIAGISALLERNVWLNQGHEDVYPNLYMMLIGSAGTRKSTAIKRIKKLLVAAGYTTIAAERTSKEKFLADLAAQHKKPESSDQDILDTNLFGVEPELAADATTPMFIAADEANDFFGLSNTEFLSILGSLYDWKGNYENRTKNSNSDKIPNPTITILGGNTATGFNTAFPSTIFGQGFFSRLLIVYGEPNGRRITIPRRPEDGETELIVSLLQAIKTSQLGPRAFGPSAYTCLDTIYQTQQVPDDSRFESFYNRRLHHLIKLCLIVSASRLETEISETSVIQANTYLTYAETLMPKALGQFGAAKNAATAQKILDYLATEDLPVPMKEIWKQVDKDFENTNDLNTVMRSLLYADKVMTASGDSGAGFMIVRKAVGDLDATRDQEKEGLVAFSEFLTPEEMEVKK